MAEISKQALKVENNQSFPNNNNGAITPAILRDFNVDMIDSLVDEQSYNIDSASWNQQIDALEQFSASASGLTTGSLLITASAVSNVITFTKGNGSTFNVTVADTTDLSQLNQATASLQQYTASANIKFTNLETTTASLLSSVSQLNASSASQQVSINNLNSTTASLLVETQNLELFSASALVSISNLNASSASQQTQINQLIAGTGSYATTGSNTFTGPNTFTSISASSFVSASTFVGDGSKLTGITASIALPILDEGIPQGNAFSMNFTGSGISAVVVGGTAVVSVNTPDSGTINNLTASFNAYTASTNLDLAALHQATASLQQFTASFSTSSLVSTSSFNSYTQSNDQRVSSLETNSASVNISIAALNTSSASQQVSIDALNVYTASQSTASIVSSISQLNQATQSLFVSASLTITTASVNNDDITFTKGDGTQFTIQVATGSFALSASYAETASLAINAKDIVVDVKNTTGIQINKGTVVRIIGATGDNPLIGTASWTDDGQSANTLGFVIADIANDAFGRVMTQGTLLNVNTDPALGYTAGQLVYLSGSGQYTNVKPPAPYHEVRLGQVLRAQQNNGSIYVLVQNGYELTELHDVDINTGSLANNDLLAWDSASQQWVNKTVTGVGALTTASFNSLTGSFATTGSNTFTGNQIVNGVLSISSSATYDLDITGGFQATASSRISGSNGVLTLSQITMTIASGSGANQLQTIIGRGYSAFNSGSSNGVALYSGILPIGGLTNAKVGGGIAVSSGSVGVYYYPIEFQATTAYTDGRVTFNNPISASAGFTASLQNGYAWVGNSLGENTQVATSSFGAPLPADLISSSAQITALGFVSSSITASSLVTASVNLNTITFTKGDASTFQLTVNTGSGGGGGAAFPYTGSAEITGSLGITGSLSGFVNTLTISSNTASLDFSRGNFFTLQLVSGSITHLTATNIEAGQTINLLVKTDSGSAAATGSLTFSPTFKFAGGIDYTPTAITASQDLVSFVTFDTTQVLASQVKNLS